MRILTSLFLALTLSTGLFAGSFEGVIKQAFYDGSSDAEYIFTWYVKGDRVALEMTAAGESAWFVPRPSEGVLLVHSNKTTDDGQAYYNLLPAGDITSNFENTDGFTARGTQQSVQVSGYDCATVELRGGGLFGSVAYAPAIDVNVGALTNFFKTSYEFAAMARAGLVGFPLSSEITSREGGVLASIQTLSVEAVSVSDEVFQAPAGAVDAATLGH